MRLWRSWARLLFRGAFSIGGNRMRGTLRGRCEEHPQYEGKTEPPARCEVCKETWEIQQGVRKESREPGWFKRTVDRMRRPGSKSRR